MKLKLKIEEKNYKMDFKAKAVSKLCVALFNEVELECRDS